MSNPPTKLPDGYWPVWKALSEADKRISSRQKLSTELRISTHTIQRILVDGNVPDLWTVKSKRVLHSWVRTITRLAIHFGEEPWEWLLSTGVPRTERIEGIVTNLTNTLDLNVNTSPNIKLKTAADPVPTLEEAYRHLRIALDQLRKKSIPKPLKSSENTAKTRKLCSSCLADLNVEENIGNSDQYCRYCSDGEGNLLPREEVLNTIADWFLEWQNDLTREEARRRADLYMQSMPAWN